MMGREKCQKDRSKSRERMHRIDTGDRGSKDRSDELTSRLSFRNGGIRVCFTGVLPDAVTATLLIGRLGEVLRPRARTTTAIALEAETAGARTWSGRCRCLFHC